ncbi:alpha/beta hydrolase [Nocardia rhizosphaerihabitans]|uniref:alpha/beta hydrolase n=1 Tax=Nocardia rhizosphaerihabitans TaxID=1691570 RepID=UPI0036703979
MGVVLLHGLGQQSADYHRFSRFLNRYAIEVWGIDHIGHGLSEGDVDGLPSVDELATSALQLISIAQSANAAIPLALVGHSLGAGTALIAMRSTSSAAQHISSVALTGTPERAHTLSVPAPEVPTLVLHGQDDRRAPIDPIRSWCTGRQTVTLREFPDAGHDLLHEPIHLAVSTAIVDFVLAQASDDLGPAKHCEAPNLHSSAMRRASAGRNHSVARARQALPMR